VVDRIVERIEITKQKKESAIPARKMGSPEKQCLLSKLKLRIPKGYPEPSSASIVDGLRAYLYNGIERLQSKGIEGTPTMREWKVS
jgi:hypothetical protein